MRMLALSGLEKENRVTLKILGKNKSEMEEAEVEIANVRLEDLTLTEVRNALLEKANSKRDIN